MSEWPMIHITARHFCAGAVIANGHIYRAAPILRYMLGWTLGQAIDYCNHKRWKWEVL